MNSTLRSLGQERAQQLFETFSSQECSEIQLSSLHSVLALSDFIFETCLRSERVFQELIEHLSISDDDILRERLLQRLDSEREQLMLLDEMALCKRLRFLRHSLWVCIAADDFLARREIIETMKILSYLAAQFFILARNWTVEQMAPRYGYAINNKNQKVHLLALGMGKLGGGELNFSSDIDLIFAYQDKGETSQGRQSVDFQVYFNKIAQKVIHLLDTQLAEGRVFRVDMRLRPFGDSGPLVSNFDALEGYYQEQGREWERYALLKASPLQQCTWQLPFEVEQIQHLSRLLKPFVYRRYIDFSVIESLRQMKSLIEQEVKRRKLVNNIKLGSGGIREVEFVVQALQLLRGGKSLGLQTTSILQALEQLVVEQVFSSEESTQLTQDYLYLRQVEQYLQAFADKQTQTLPQSELDKTRLAELLNVPQWQDVLSALHVRQSAIRDAFQDVVGGGEEQSPEVDVAQHWVDLWFDPKAASSVVAGDVSEYLVGQKPDLLRMVSGQRGLEQLNLLMPNLLQLWHEQGWQLLQLKQILLIVRKLVSRTAYLDLLIENPGALKQLMSLTASSKFIATQMERFPLLLDQLIDPKQLYEVPKLSNYQAELQRRLLRVDPEDLEQQMEVLRQFKLSSQLIIAACDVQNVITVMEISDHLTEIAQVCVNQVVELAWQQMTERYGLPAGSSNVQKNFAVIAYGKMAGFELGYGSDLDLVFVHNCNSHTPTDGRKSIDSRQFYLKLAQRILHMFTTKTLSGELYELDTRLRPSGASGLLAINIETFADYQRNEAWTWEHQALVRSRIIFGDEKLTSQFDLVRHEILTRVRDLDELSEEIKQMRQKMFDNLSKESDDLFDLKQSRGGIADIEFISQYLVLAHSRKFANLLIYSDNVRILENAEQSGLITVEERELLLNAYLTYRGYAHKAALNELPGLQNKETLSNCYEQVIEAWQRILK